MKRIMPPSCVSFIYEDTTFRLNNSLYSNQSDWEASSDEEEKLKTASAAVAPPKKKGTLKAKLAEKAALKAAVEDDDEYDEDSVLDPREKARRDRERELQADLNNAADLMGAAALGGTRVAHIHTCASHLTDEKALPRRNLIL